MITKIEASRDGSPLRVYHRAGYTPIQGADTKYSWTHAADAKTRAACDACAAGTIPLSVKTA